MFCPQPFEQIEIYESGDVYTCCPDFINFLSLGNIFKQPFSEIWNGEKATNFREKILSGDFSLCNNICNRKLSFLCSDIPEIYKNPNLDGFPKIIAVSSDNSCNVQCKICRDKLINNKYSENEIRDEIFKYWLPIFKDAKIVRFGCSGEPFFSLKEKLLIKSVAENYPDIKFDIHTNGILGNEKLLTDLGILNKLNEITVSIHASREKTYKKIVNYGNYKKVRENIKLYSNLRKKNLLNRLRFIFVVTAYNYKEMPDFVKLAKNLGADVEFWAYRKNDTALSDDFTSISVIDSTNKLHNDFLKILKNPLFDEKNVKLYPEINTLRRKIL